MADDDNFDIDIYGDDSYQDSSVQQDTTITDSNTPNTEARRQTARVIMTRAPNRSHPQEARLALTFTNKHLSNRVQSASRAKTMIAQLTPAPLQLL